MVSGVWAPGGVVGPLPCQVCQLHPAGRKTVGTSVLGGTYGYVREGGYMLTSGGAGGDIHGGYQCLDE